MRPLVVIAAALAIGACRRDGGDRREAAPPAASRAPEPPAPPLKYATAEDFWKDYTGTPSQKLMERFMARRVELAGAVRQVIDADPEYALWLDAGGGRRIDLRFTDPGAAKARAKKAGDPVAAECAIGGMDDNAIYLVDCDLK